MVRNDAIDLVIPMYNERENVRPLYEEVETALESVIDYRVIFVDDGSDDGSTEILKELSKSESAVETLHFHRNRGQSAAFAAGFDATANPLVATLDGDRQNNPADLPDLIDKLHREGTDVVLGYREERRDGLKKRMGSYVANCVRNWVLGENIRDTGCSLKVFRKEVVDSFPRFEGMHRFFPSLVLMNGFSFTQAPTEHRSRPWGETKYSITGRLRKVVFDLLGVAWLKARSLDTRVDESSVGPERQR